MDLAIRDIIACCIAIAQVEHEHSLNTQNTLNYSPTHVSYGVYSLLSLEELQRDSTEYIDNSSGIYITTRMHS